MLVVDDHPVTQTIQRVPENAGHVVRIAGDGQKALARSEQDSFQDSFDVAIPGIFMPGAVGPEALGTILRRTPDVVIIMTSGRSHTPTSISKPDYLTMATRTGAVSALLKPFEPA